MDYNKNIIKNMHKNLYNIQNAFLTLSKKNKKTLVGKNLKKQINNLNSEITFLSIPQRNIIKSPNVSITDSDKFKSFSEVNNKYRRKKNNIEISGSQGKIYKYYNNQNTTIIKIISLNRHVKYPIKISDKNVRTQALNEIYILDIIKSKYCNSYYNYIPKIYDIYQNNQSDKLNLLIQMENFDTSLEEYCKLNSYDEMKLIKKIRNIYLFINILGIIHNDIKPDNFVLNDNQENSLRIIDFGCVSFIDSIPTCTTLKYASPELNLKLYGNINELKDFLNIEHSIDIEITFSSDIWAYGLTIYYILTNGKHFFDSDPKCLDDYINRLKIFENEIIENPKLSYINNFIKINPSERLFT